MHPNIRHLLTVSFAMLVAQYCFAQQDCSTAISVCSNSFSQSNSYSGVGTTQEVQAGTSCLDNGEVNSVWYTFTVSASGTLEFQLNPLNPNDDYDFALYNLTGDSCNSISSGTNVPVSCNYSADPGPTGLITGGSGSQNGSSDSNQNAPLSVQAGEVYSLIISNFTASQSGYSLDFSGSASIGDNQPAVLDTVGMNALCNPNSILLWFDQEIACSSIASGTFDIQITGPEPVTISSLSGIGCNDGTTDWLSIGFANSIQTTGTYNVTVQVGGDNNTFLDACGNETPPGNSISFNVDFIGPDLSLVSSADASCGNDNGSAEVVASGGTPPYTYWWNTSPTQNSSSATNLSSGSYRAWVTDANGCNKWLDVAISNNTPVDLTDISATPVSCHGASDGTALINPIGGVEPYSIEWQSSPIQTSTNATNLPGGTVSVLVTDNDGCLTSTSVNVPQPSPINLPTSIVNPDCGLSNGSATVNANGGNGGFIYEWDTSPVQSTATASTLMAGVYTVDVIDQNGCSASTSVILTDNFAPNATIESRIPDCGQGVGQATAVATSGAAPYSYSWSTVPQQNTATAVGLSEGDYYVTVTDANNCVQIINVKIDSVPPPEISLAISQPNCGETDGEVEAIVSNGISPLTYSWSSSSNTSNIETGLGSGTYDVSVIDSSGCATIETFVLEELPPESEMSMTNVCLGEESMFSFTTNSGTTSWIWDFGDGNTSTDQSPAHTYSNPGDYTVTLTLNGGCMTDQVTGTSEVFEQPSAEFTYSPEIPTTRSSIEFVNTGTGGTSFLWDLGDGTTETGPRPSHQYGVDGTYDVLLTVTDENGCQDTTTVSIEVLLSPVIYFPNAIMIEGTEENNHFQGYGIGVTSAELSIFDRWGTLLYFSSNTNEIMSTGWNGKFNGTLVKQGAYPYKVKATFYNNSSFEKLGTITVIR